MNTGFWDQPSPVPGLTNGQVHGILRGVSGPTIVGPIILDLAASYINNFGGGSSPWRHREIGQETHQN
jgi:hypothetical protein